MQGCMSKKLLIINHTFLQKCKWSAGGLTDLDAHCKFLNMVLITVNRLSKCTRKILGFLLYEHAPYIYKCVCVCVYIYIGTQAYLFVSMCKYWYKRFYDIEILLGLKLIITA